MEPRYSERISFCLSFIFFFPPLSPSSSSSLGCICGSRWDGSVLRPLSTDGARPPTFRHNYCITQQCFPLLFPSSAPPSTPPSPLISAFLQILNWSPSPALLTRKQLVVAKKKILLIVIWWSTYCYCVRVRLHLSSVPIVLPLFVRPAEAGKRAERSESKKASYAPSGETAVCL